jgi:uncharacterized protein
VVALLDVNILIALFDATHVFHDVAHRWFAQNRRNRWATCALTENAFVRISCNPAYYGNRPTLREAINGLRNLCRADDHVFWMERISVRDHDRFDWNRVQGYRQIADVYLLALAVSNAGRLASFDKAVPLKGVVGATSQNLEIIGS